MSILRRIINKISWEYRRYIHFGIGNYNLIKSGKLVCDIKKINFYQRVYIYKDGGRYVLGDGVQFGYDIGGRNKRGYVELQARTKKSSIRIGQRVAFNNNCTILVCGNVSIGDCCRIGSEVEIIDFDGHGVPPNKRGNVGKIAPVHIGDNVWIGNRATILAGTIIGDNSIVAAGAVVKGIFPNNVIIGGVPAKIIKKIEEDDKNAETK